MRNDPYQPFDTLFEKYYGTNPVNTRETVRSLLWTGNIAIVTWLDDNSIHPEDVTIDDAINFFEELSENYSETVQFNKAHMVAFFFSKMNDRGWIDIDKNPFMIALEDHDVLDQVVDRDVKIYSVEEVREVLEELHPIYFTASMIQLKTTRRIGGVCNLDMCDVHLDHPGADWEVVEGLVDKPDHLYFSPKPVKGEVFRGEVRTDSAKSQTETYIPIDDELKDCLLFLLSIRRSSEMTGPLMTNIGSVEPGKRLRSSSFSSILNRVAKDKDYYVEPYHPNNIRTHYWRHWTTTHMKDRVNSSIVDYFRGDKKDMSDHYNHWSEEKARKWVDNIPKIFERYQRY